MSKNPVQKRRGTALKEKIPATAASPGNEGEAARVGRNATERLLAIHQLIFARRYPNTARLAREFDVSQKTVKRDVEWMRVHWNLPIEYDRQRYGYFCSREVKQFPGVPTITEAEIFALLVAHKAVEQYSGTPFHKPLQIARPLWLGYLIRRPVHSRTYFSCWSSIRAASCALAAVMQAN